MKKLIRALIYLLGMVVLSLGITLNTKTGLGVSPIISVAYCVSRLWGLGFGDMTFLLYALFILAQLALRPRREYPSTLLQLAVSLLFSRLLDLFNALIVYDSAARGLPANLALLLLAILLTGAGVAMTVDMCLVPNPGDGIVQAIARRIGRDQGFTKNVFDLGCVCVTLLLGFVWGQPLLGVGLGTVAAMIGVGRAIAAFNALFKEKLCAAAGVEAPAT